MIGFGIGELIGVIALGTYVVGDPDKWGNDAYGLARRALAGVHCLLVFAGLEVAVLHAEIEPMWLRLVLYGTNVFLFPALAVAVFKGFPRSLWSGLELVIVPMIVAVGLSVAAALWPGRLADLPSAASWFFSSGALFAEAALAGVLYSVAAFLAFAGLLFRGQTLGALLRQRMAWVWFAWIGVALTQGGFGLWAARDVLFDGRGPVQVLAVLAFALTVWRTRRVLQRGLTRGA